MNDDISSVRTTGRMIDLERHEDQRGFLVTIQSAKDVPFVIQRVYMIYPADPSVRRGCHAHHTEKQLLVSQCGSCKVLLDDGQNRVAYLLNDPGKGLLIDQFIWREMFDFSPDCILTVLSDSIYDPIDYLFDYDEFLQCAKRRDVFVDD